MVRYLCPAALLAATTIACGASAPPPARSPSNGAQLLARCARDASPPQAAEQVTSWSCEDLTAVETLVLSASDQDIALAFDGFAANFPGHGVKRVDAKYIQGDTRRTAMRLEGNGPSGETIEAQMVAVAIGNGVRLVTCSSKDRRSPCGPVIEMLVQERAGQAN